MLSFDSQVRYCKSGYEDADAIMLFFYPSFFQSSHYNDT